MLTMPFQSSSNPLTHSPHTCDNITFSSIRPLLQTLPSLYTNSNICNHAGHIIGTDPHPGSLQFDASCLDDNTLRIPNRNVLFIFSNILDR
jgi:hypothetical protein